MNERTSSTRLSSVWRPTVLEMLVNPRRFFSKPSLLRQGWGHSIAKTLGTLGGAVVLVLMVLSWQGGLSQWSLFDATMLRLESSWSSFWGWVGAIALTIGWALTAALERLYHWNCESHSKRFVDYLSAVAVARWASLLFSIPVLIVMLGSTLMFREPADFLSLGRHLFGLVSIAWVLMVWLSYFGAKVAFQVTSLKAVVLLFIGPAQWGWLGVFMGYQLQDQHVLRPNLQSAAAYKDDAMSFRYPANWSVSKHTDGRVVIDTGDRENVLYLEPIDDRDDGQSWLNGTVESLKAGRDAECDQIDAEVLRPFVEGQRCATRQGRRVTEIDLRLLVGKRHKLSVSKVVTRRNKAKLEPGFHLIEQTLE